MKKNQSLQRFLIFYTLSLFIILIIYYILLYRALLNQEQQYSETVFTNILYDAKKQKLTSPTTFNPTEISFDFDDIQQLPSLQNMSYQLILLTPSGQTLIKKQFKHQDDGEVLAALPQLRNNNNNTYYKIDKQQLQGWIILGDGYQLYVNLRNNPIKIDWRLPQYWLPLLFASILFGLVAFFLLRRVNNWEKIIQYARQLSATSQESYKPLPFYQYDIGQEFLRLGHALGKLNYQLYQNKQRIDIFKKRLQQMVDSSPLPMFIIHRNGQMTFFNKRFEQVFMLSFQREKSYYLTDFIMGNDKETQLLLNKLSNQRMARTLLVQHLENKHVYQLHIMPWFGEHNQVQGITGVLNDVHCFSQELQTANFQLLQQQKRLTEFDKLWSVLGHELRTPLSGMIGMLELLDSENLTQEQQETFSILKQTSDTMLYLLNDMLDVAKMDAGKLNVVIETTDILKLCQQVCDLMVGNARRQGIELLYFFDPTCPRYLETDAARLRQILLNLVSNAIKFTKTGFVALIVGLLDENDSRANQAKIKFKPRHFNNSDNKDQLQKLLCLSIKDTGIGIQKDEQQKLFSYFNQANDSISKQFGGTGLGLAISNNFTRLLGGYIHLQSEIHQGSVFSVCLPYDKSHYQPVYHFNTKLSNLCLLVFTSQSISAKYLTELFNYLSLPAIIRIGISSNDLESITKVLNNYIIRNLQPIVLVEYELYDIQNNTFLQHKQHNVNLLSSLPNYINLPKILLSMMPERGISPLLLEQYDGYLAKPISVSHLLTEMVRLSQPTYKKQMQDPALSKAQQSFNQFLSSMQQDTTEPSCQSDGNTISLTGDNKVKTKQNLEQEKSQYTSTHTLKEEKKAEKVQTAEQKLILVAEDNLMNQKVACKVLNKLGYHSIVANNGQEALDMLAKQREEISLILMDCRMPIMDGLTATQHIRANQDDIPIVALTANDTDDDRNACLEAGMNGFLSKPLKKDFLEDMLKKFIN